MTSTLQRGDTFGAYSELRLDEELRDEALAILENYGVHGEPAFAIARRAVAAGSAFFAGDETGPVAPVDPSVLDPWSCLAAEVVGGLLDALCTDLAPADNDVTFMVD